MEINALVTELYKAKQAEKDAKDRRTALEAELEKAIGLPDNWEGTQTRPIGDYKVKLVRKLNVKIDANRLREQARVYNMLPALNRCFRWKPEVVKKEWDAANDKVKLAFAPAMEVTPGKASFTVTPVEEAGINWRGSLPVQVAYKKAKQEVLV